MAEIKEVKMEVQSVVDLAVKFKHSADWTCHEMSRARASKPIPCTDVKIAEFVQRLESGIDIAELTISDLYWEESGNCVGDNLYPVILEAVKLPDGRYYLRLEGLFDDEESGYGKIKLKEYIYQADN